MKRKHITISIVLATIMLVSLFSVVSSAASVSGQASGTTASLSTNVVGGTMAGTGPAAATSFGTSQTLIFAVDTSHHLWNTSETPSGGGVWNALGGYATSSPAAVSRNPGGFTVFARGSDGAVWYRDYVGGSWGNWVSIGGQIPAGTGPAVCSWGLGRLDVFARGTDGALWHKSYTTANGWSTNWDSLGGSPTSSPAATVAGPPTLSPAATAPVATATSLGGSPALSPAVTVPVTTMDVFARGSDGAVWYRNWNGAQWSSWQSLGGQVTPNTGPAVSQDLWLIAQGSTDHQLWQRNLGGAGTGWESVGVTPPAAPSASSPGAVSTVTNEHALVCFSSTSGTVFYGVHDVSGLISSWSSAGSPP